MWSLHPRVDWWLVAMLLDTIPRYVGSAQDSQALTVIWIN